MQRKKGQNKQGSQVVEVAKKQPATVTTTVVPKKETAAPKKVKTKKTGQEGFGLAIFLTIAFSIVASIGLAYVYVWPLFNKMSIAPEGFGVAGQIQRRPWNPDQPFSVEISSQRAPVILEGVAFKRWPNLAKWTMESVTSNPDLKVMTGVKEAGRPTFPYFDSGAALAKASNKAKPLGNIERERNPYVTHNISGTELYDRIKASPNSHAYQYWNNRVPASLASDLHPADLLFRPEDDERYIDLWLGGKGVTAHPHYDSYHNFYIQVVGRKRFVVFPPAEHLSLYVNSFLHPVWGQSRANFSSPDPLSFPHLKDAHGYESILEPGDMLYVPPFWFHYVQALEPAASLSAWSTSREFNAMAAAFTVPLPFNPEWDEPQRLRAVFLYIRLFIESIVKDDYRLHILDLLHSRYPNDVRSMGWENAGMAKPPLYAVHPDHQRIKDMICNTTAYTQERNNNRYSFTAMIQRVMEHFRMVPRGVAMLHANNYIEEVALRGLHNDAPKVVTFLDAMLHCEFVPHQ